MATGGEVLKMLCPDREWTIYGDDYDSIIWFDKSPAITKEEFLAGFAKVDEWKAKEVAVKAAAKADLLNRLGITENEAKLLLA